MVSRTRRSIYRPDSAVAFLTQVKRLSVRLFETLRRDPLLRSHPFRRTLVSMALINVTHDQRHKSQSVNVQRTSGRWTEIYHSTVHERTAIVDAYDHRASVAAVDDGDSRAEW